MDVIVTEGGHQHGGKQYILSCPRKELECVRPPLVLLLLRPGPDIRAACCVEVVLVYLARWCRPSRREVEAVPATTLEELEVSGG